MDSTNDMQARQYRGMCKCLLAVHNPEDIGDAISDFKIVLLQQKASSWQVAQLIGTDNKQIRNVFHRYL